jgi:hypothetical protein
MRCGIAGIVYQMLIRLFQGSMLLALTVGIHTVVLSAMLSRINKHYRDNVPLRNLRDHRLRRYRAAGDLASARGDGRTHRDPDVRLVRSFLLRGG